MESVDIEIKSYRINKLILKSGEAVTPKRKYFLYGSNPTRPPVQPATGTNGPKN